MGRPTKRKKDSFLKIRVSQTDLIILDSVAKLYNTNRSNIVRNILWNFFDTQAELLLHGKFDKEHPYEPIDDLYLDGLDTLYGIVASDEEYSEFVKEMERRENIYNSFENEETK